MPMIRVTIVVEMEQDDNAKQLTKDYKARNGFDWNDLLGVIDEDDVRKVKFEDLD